VKKRSVASARLPDFVEPMQAKLVDCMRSGDWIYEISPVFWRCDGNELMQQASADAPRA
jgi:hypothetical protein